MNAPKARRKRTRRPLPPLIEEMRDSGDVVLLVTLSNSTHKAIVSVEDGPLVGQHRWYLNSHGYAQTKVYRDDGTRACLYMHVLVLGGLPKGKMTDHANGDRLDNRRANLRLATYSQNSANTPARGKVSRYKGVWMNNHCRKWTSMIKDNGHVRYLGVFLSEEDAARAYDAAAKELHGDFACLNFPESGRCAARAAA